MTRPTFTSPHPPPRRWRILGLLGIAQLMLILDVTVVAVALPRLSADLGLGRQQLTWVVSGYTLAFGGLLLLGGRAADPFAGALALGVWSALGGGGAALGVLLGGLLTAGPGWPWVFFVNVPVGLYGAFLVRARHAAQPLLDLRLLVRRPVALGALLVLVATALMITVYFLGSFYLAGPRQRPAHGRTYIGPNPDLSDAVEALNVQGQGPSGQRTSSAVVSSRVSPGRDFTGRAQALVRLCFQSAGWFLGSESGPRLERCRLVTIRYQGSGRIRFSSQRAPCPQAAVSPGAGCAR